MDKIKYLSLFSGIGGFELGIGEKGECVGYSETDKYAAQIYERHFKHRAFGDVTKIDTKELPDFQLLVGGVPCQSFSIAGKRGGFNDTRGTLFIEIARLVREKRPRLLLLENVKGLLSHDKGDTFLAIITTLDELGYDLQWQVLNSKNFGVPQNRERVFIVGHLRGTGRPEVFPLGKDCEADNVVPTLTTRYQGAQSTGAYLRQLIPKGTADAFRVYDGDGLARTLKGEAGGCGGKTGLYMLTEKRTEEAMRIRRESKERDYSPRRGKYLAPREDNIGNCITAGQSKEHLLSDGISIRRLTPTECERLQGFPDGWTEGVSDTQRYKCLGNAVTVNVVRAIIEKLLLKDVTSEILNK